ncbi:MAG: HAMP domain-containing protein [Magnetococcus sp. YQC-5]
MRLDDLPIRLKLPLTIGVGLFLFAGVVLLYTLTLRQTIREYEHLHDYELTIHSAARTILIEVLQARRAEKNFLTTREWNQLDKVEQRIGQAEEAAHLIQRLSQGRGIGEEVRPRMVLLDHLVSYREQMQLIGEAWKRKGLTHQKGLQGRFRQEAHALEDAMQRLERSGGSAAVQVQHLSAMVDYLSMRRKEKDYLLSLNQETSAADVEQHATRLGERMRRILPSGEELERLEGVLQAYRAAFRALVDIDREIDGSMNRLREEIHRVETLSEEIDQLASRLAAQGGVATQQGAERQAVWIFVVSLLTIVVCGWLTLRMVRSLVRAISDLSRFAREVANGNLDATTTLNRGDEIGHLAEVMRAMVQRMRAIRLIAERMVTVLALIGRGSIPDPLDAEFHGDFKKITDALNDLITRLGIIRRVALHMDRIRHGEIPEKLEGDVQGDFRRLYDSMNQIIDKLREIGGLPLTEQ